MKKNILILSLLLFGIALKAQNYGNLNAVLEKLERKQKQNQEAFDFDIDQKRFLLVKEFDDHTERQVLEIRGNLITLIEIFDDKKDGSSTSNIFTGDVVRHKNVVSVRANLLEGKPIQIPVTYTFLLNNQKSIWYLINANNKERWIEAKSISKK